MENEEKKTEGWEEGDKDNAEREKAVFEPIPAEVETAAREIIGAAIEVHRHLGPGLLESVYERAMVHELQRRGMTVHQQVPIVVIYKDIRIEGQRADLVVEPGVIVELKAVEAFTHIHRGKLVSYLKSTGFRLGLLINFHAEVLKKGIQRIAC